MTYVHCVALPCRPADHVDVALLQLVSDQRMNEWVEGGLLHEQCRIEAGNQTVTRSSYPDICAQLRC